MSDLEKTRIIGPLEEQNSLSGSNQSHSTVWTHPLLFASLTY